MLSTNGIIFKGPEHLLILLKSEALGGAQQVFALESRELQNILKSHCGRPSCYRIQRANSSLLSNF